MGLWGTQESMSAALTLVSDALPWNSPPAYTANPRCPRCPREAFPRRRGEAGWQDLLKRDERKALKSSNGHGRSEDKPPIPALSP